LLLHECVEDRGTVTANDTSDKAHAAMKARIGFSCFPTIPR
jgi:hypothetical protein